MSLARPRWFVSRGAGVYTALIPADELPNSVNLQGVSRNMTVNQVVGMTLVAETGPSGQCYCLDQQLFDPDQALIKPGVATPVVPSSNQFFAPDAHVGDASSHQSPASASTGGEMNSDVEKPQANLMHTRRRNAFS